MRSVKENEVLGASVGTGRQERMIVSEADDLASQNCSLVSPDLYRKSSNGVTRNCSPIIKKHAAVDVKIFYHSCGAIMP